jgi:hypothetical protein
MADLDRRLTLVLAAIGYLAVVQAATRADFTPPAGRANAAN